MQRILTVLTLITCLIAPTMADGTDQKPFPVAPHDNVTIEWWYLNAHVTTEKGRHLAMIASFFRFGNGQGQMAIDSSLKAAQSHYLIWAVTDEDTGAHMAYSLGDKKTLSLLTQAATLQLLVDPKNTRAQKLLESLNKGQFPPPTELIRGTAKVTMDPFWAVYGSGDTLTEYPGKNMFSLSLARTDSKTGGPAAKNTNPAELGSGLQLYFTSTKTPMFVGGNGETGIDKPSDMHYVSLSRCDVVGAIDGDKVKTGQGWIDHQWGDSWTTERVGWDWWGVQLDNGTDINFFRMRDLATGRIFKPMATFQDKDGKLTVTKDIVFAPDAASTWKSPHSGASYPLKWTVTFPDQYLQLRISPVGQDQEMPVLANGGYIWEGSCHVTADPAFGLEMFRAVPPVAGVAYQELVGYNSR